MNNAFVNGNSSKEHRFGAFKNRHEAILAVVPPLLLGFGSAFAILTNQLVASIATWICIALAISAGAAIALIRGMPIWGDIWLGTFIIFSALILRLLMEEGKGASLSVSSPLMSSVITVFVFFMLMVLIITIVLKGWRRVGLVSIGLSTTLVIGIWITFARPPFNREDLALLVAPIGIVTAVCTYLYMRKSDMVRVFSLIFVWLLCLSTVWMANHVYHEWFNERGRAFPFIALMIILSVLLWAGPFMVWTISFGRKMAKHLPIKKNA